MGNRILLIEDNSTNLELMSYLLNAFGHTTIEARDGEEGVEKALQAIPDLILCDLGLPKLDGYGVARRLKAEPSLSAVPLIAVTASAMVGDREKVIAVGFDGYISKPITPETFVVEVESYLPKQTAVATILIVDDLSVNREFLVTLLRYKGYRLIEAANGREALAAVQSKRPDLVITDVLMPVMDGFEFVRHLRLDPATSGIPVVFCTAHYGEREARALALSLGVSCVLTKPAEPEDVLRVVRRVLSHELEPQKPLAASSPAIEFDREHLRLLTDKLSEKAEDLKTANARLRALINIGMELASERDSGRLLQNVSTAARDLFGATYVTLGILDRQDRTLQRLVTSGVEAAEWIQIGDSISGMLGAVVAERRALRGNNPGGDPAILELPLLHPEVQAFLVVPVASPAHVYGWLCLAGNEGRTFTEDDEHLLMALSGQVGRIYENGYFYGIAQKRAKELEQEVLERKQGAEALRISEERMRFAMEAAGVGIWDMDCTSGVLRWSETIEAQYGLQAGTFGGKFNAFVELIHPGDRQSVIETVGKAMTSGHDFSTLNRSIRSDATVRWLSGAGRFHLGEDGNPVRGIGISTDVTERRSLEQQYQQAQKMEAVGRLAGGVAHDFNNLLTVILGYCDLLLAGRISDDQRRQSAIATIQQAGMRAAGLTRQLLAFSRKQVIEPMLLDLNVVVADIQRMFERLIGEDVNVLVRLHAEPVWLRADRGQLEQIVMNLAVNARDAMPKGGTLTIETSTVELDKEYSKTHIAGNSGVYVVLTVADTGTGMTEHVRAHLFEPFFTTKEIGRGTGLGLATVHGIVTRSGGIIDVFSEIGKGTSFKLYFPKAEREEPVVEGLSQVIRPRAVGQTVLVVEDAKEVRELTVILLQEQRYTVLAAADADEAVRLFDRNASIDVLLTDVIMPGSSGLELAERLVKQRPTLKVICMSGYTGQTIDDHGLLNPEFALLHKPFTSEILGQKIREVLDR